MAPELGLYACTLVTGVGDDTAIELLLKAASEVTSLVEAVTGEPTPAGDIVGTMAGQRADVPDTTSPPESGASRSVLRKSAR